MQGWKMVAARRAAARIVDTLAASDRFAVLTFDDRIDRPADLAPGLIAATDRHRYRAVEHLSRADARGGTVLLEPLEQGLGLLATGDDGRDRVLVLITDGQVGNEDQILGATSGLVRGVRVHTVGIDQAVNAGFLGRLAAAGGGRCELVESEDRLDDAMDAIHRRIKAPLVTGLRLAGEMLIDGTVSPTHLPDLFSGVPTVVRGRYRIAPPTLSLAGSTRDGQPWQVTAPAAVAADRAIAQLWARAMLRDLEDAYVAAPSDALEQRIVATSLRFGVLCRFTAFVAIDSRVVNEGGELHRVIQPVELPAGWAAPPTMPVPAPAFAMPASVSSMSAPESAAAGTPTSGRMPRLSAEGPVRELQHGDVELAGARAQAAEEARRLEHPARSEWDRRDALDDLATRLEALIRHLQSRGVDPGALPTIVAMLRDHTLATTQRWDQARRALSEFAAASSRSAAPFWKRQ
jgi:Ca-activated chloride channel family protein